MARYQYTRFPYRTPAELQDESTARTPVLIVGAGPIGLCAAIDLALHGIASMVIDDNDVVSIGSRAICWSKRSLEILERLGVGQRIVDKGVTWKVGRLYHRDREVYSFDMLPEGGHHFPAFVNLQQYYVEEYLVARAQDFPDLIDLRFKNRFTALQQHPDRVVAQVETPDGSYAVEADYLLACDGVRSAVRTALGLDFAGRVFEERFLIADVELKADFPSERWFWFEPPFHAGQSALLHKQADDIYRIDLQLGPDADPEEEKKPEKVIPRIRAMIGERPFELDWVSVYTFQCRRLERFVHDRVIFAGDSAHVVSPFGARGGNGGIQDVDNLCWKLAAILKGEAGQGLLASYDEERIHGADENIRNSARATNFMTPKSAMEKRFRDEILNLAAVHPFARRMVNSGRLSIACSLAGFPLQSADDPAFSGAMVPGAPCADAPVIASSGTDAAGTAGWLLDHLGGRFHLLSFGGPVAAPAGLPQVVVGDGPEQLRDVEGLVARRYDARPGAAYLIRPDQHVAARFAAPTAERIVAAWRRALGDGGPADALQAGGQAA